MQRGDRKGALTRKENPEKDKVSNTTCGRRISKIVTQISRSKWTGTKKKLVVFKRVTVSFNRLEKRAWRLCPVKGFLWKDQMEDTN